MASFMGSAQRRDKPAPVWFCTESDRRRLRQPFSAAAGGRYTEDKKHGILTFSRNINYLVNTAAAAANGYKPLDKTWHRFNPMVTVAYDLSNTIHAYAKYATGYRAGGASSRTANYQAFDPEDVKSYEVGLKADFWDHRARLNLAGYIMQRKDSQVDLSTIQPTATGNFNNLVTFNAPGNTKIRGIEADLTVAPVEGLTLNASYAYAYTNVPLVPVTYREFTAAKDGEMKGMPGIAALAKPKKGEVTICAFAGFSSRAHRDRANAAAMKDPRMAKMMTRKPLFDMKRMRVGGFDLLVMM